MRKIKFRNWDGVKFLYSDSLSYFGLENKSERFQFFCKLATFFNLPISNKEVEESLIQQYTGSKDINNKEIYEGDILRYCELNYKVKWDKDCWAAVCPNYNPYHWPKLQFFFRDSSCSSIIGNIFENPELLKQNERS